MKKIVLSQAHLDKRKQRKRFVLRDDIFCTILQQKMCVKDYFDFSFSFPDEVDKVIIDGMYSGDWYSVYESEILPLRQNPMLARFRDAGIDIFDEWIKHVHGRQKECWLTYRISEVDVDEDINPLPIKEEHPEWFIPAFGFTMNNMAVPEIREHKLKVALEVMRKYAFDGLDIDFERHTPILPIGEQWEKRECVTEFIRELRTELLKIGKEQNRVIMLSARVPDCLDGCHQDGLDVEKWIKEDLVDCLTLGSRSFDVKVEEFRKLSKDVQLYACYEPYHTVDGYFAPPLETLRGIWYSHLQRGADAVEYFNWSGQGKKEMVAHYVHLYGMDPKNEDYAQFGSEDFTGANDKEFLEKQNKTYVIDRKGGYPWGIGYGNLNADRQLPRVIENDEEVRLYVAENVKKAKRATLKLLFEELSQIPEVYFNGQKLSFLSQPHRDMQVTAEKIPPISGHPVSVRLAHGEDHSKSCTLLEADLTGMETQTGYNIIHVLTKMPVSLEKVELEVKRI